MAANDLLKFCRYYKGEDKCPFDDERTTLWYYERAWYLDFTKNKSPILEEYTNEYILAGLKDLDKYSEIPISLKALLFNRFRKDSYNDLYEDAKRFEKFYNEHYKSEA